MPFLGALHKFTKNGIIIKEYVYPSIANKKNKYVCPDCNKKLIFCKGKINRPYFRHKADTSTCAYYNEPSESQIHKDAKMLLKKLLQTYDLTFSRKCTQCFQTHNHKIKHTHESNIKLEHKFKYNGNRSADVAYIKNNTIKYIFEICHTNSTLENNRPEPWFEVDAKTLIDNPNKHIISCLRKKKCDLCIKKNENYKRFIGENCKGNGTCFYHKFDRYDINKYCKYKCERQQCIFCNVSKSKNDMEHHACNKCRDKLLDNEYLIYFNIPLSDEQYVTKLSVNYCEESNKWYSKINKPNVKILIEKYKIYAIKFYEYSDFIILNKKNTKRFLKIFKDNHNICLNFIY